MMHMPKFYPLQIIDIQPPGTMGYAIPQSN